MPRYIVLNMPVTISYPGDYVEFPGGAGDLPLADFVMNQPPKVIKALQQLQTKFDSVLIFHMDKNPSMILRSLAEGEKADHGVFDNRGLSASQAKTDGYSSYIVTSDSSLAIELMSFVKKLKSKPYLGLWVVQFREYEQLSPTSDLTARTFPAESTSTTTAALKPSTQEQGFFLQEMRAEAHILIEAKKSRQTHWTASWYSPIVNRGGKSFGQFQSEIDALEVLRTKLDFLRASGRDPDQTFPEAVASIIEDIELRFPYSIRKHGTGSGEAKVALFLAKLRNDTNEKFGKQFANFGEALT